MRAGLSCGLLLLLCGGALGLTMEDKIMSKSGVVAFWDFKKKGTSGYFVAQTNVAGSPSGDLYPVALRSGTSHTGPKYTEANWPFSHQPVNTNADGPFGHALNIESQTMWATVDRAEFSNTPLDISGHQPFTLVAWVKIAAGSNRHHMVGIWDEGSWGKYSGQRQYALFSINGYGPHLFGHISATGAATYPQSTVSGAQYARIRALNGAVTLPEAEWKMLAMSYDGSEVKSYQDGVSTPYDYTPQQEWVEEDVYKQYYNPKTNPKAFDWGVYHPLKFVVKFNGYNVNSDQVFELYVNVDLKSSPQKLSFGVRAPNLAAVSGRTYTVEYDFVRGGLSYRSGSFAVANNAGTGTLSSAVSIETDDQLKLRLRKSDGTLVGDEVTRYLGLGAPFGFGRILGTGTTFALGGAVMYNRVLSAAELADLAAPPTGTPVPPTTTPQPPAGCTDKTLASGAPWRDSYGAQYTCAWYAAVANRCSRYGSGYAFEGMTANNACCTCGGGNQ